MKNAVLFLVLFVHQLTAQTEFPFLNGTTLQSKEILTSIYQERIALLNINQTDSIQCVLSDWKNTWSWLKRNVWFVSRYK